MNDRLCGHHVIGGTHPQAVLTEGACALDHPRYATRAAWLGQQPARTTLVKQAAELHYPRVPSAAAAAQGHFS